MNRVLATLTAGMLCALAACGDDDEPPVTITLFQAAPDAIELGQSTKLVFLVNPPDAHIAIGGLGDLTGQADATVSPTQTTVYHLTATRGTLSASKDVTVTVGPQTATTLKLEPATATPIAGDALAVTVSAIAGNGKVAPGFRGTVHLTSSDPKAMLPVDVVFGAGDAGVKQVTVTLETAGVNTVTGTDTTTTARQGTASVTVGAAAAARCVAAQAPASATAGAIVGLAIVIEDLFGNRATTYAGTVKLTATDVRAILPAEVTYVPIVDGGSHVFSASLLTTGSQVLTATDIASSAIACEAPILVTPAAPKLVLGVPSHVNAGYAVPVAVVARDLFDNPLTGFTGTVSFTSTDAGASAPAPITFTGSEGGVATTSVTFVTLGAQVLLASDGGSPAAAGAAASAVHGLVYNAPTAGRVRLVANAPLSTTQVVQLDLIANERLEISSFFGGGPGSFAAGMNLPLDTTRVTDDTTLFIPGPALPAGAGPRAAAARIGATDHVLYTAVSRKRTPGSTFPQGTEVQAGQVFYSVRLKLTPAGTVGPVFDGNQPSPLFRAAVRDQFGDDFVSQSEFGVGKLEIR